MVNKSILGIGIVAAAAYLYFRSKRGDSIPQNNVIKEVAAIEPNQTEIRINEINSEIATLQHSLSAETAAILGGGANIFLANRAKSVNPQIARLETELAGLQTEV